MDTSKIAIVYRHMCGHKGGSIHNLLGLMASKIPAIKHLKYCRECNSESINLRGELYFNRLHQLSTVLFCPIHDIPLLSSVINIKQYNRHQFVYPDAKLMRTGLIADYQCVDRKMLITVAKAYKELIECRLDLHGKDFRNAYLSLLKLRGLIRGSCTVDNAKLMSEFRSYFGESLLGTLYSSDIERWLLEIVRKHRKSFHPVRHILMIIFLAGSLDEFARYTVVRDVVSSESKKSILRSITSHHKGWLALVERYPEKLKSELRKLSPKIYMWLYRNDKEWLGRNSPDRRIPVAMNKRVDWTQRDKVIVKEVIVAIRRIKASENPFLRITAGRIGKMIGKLNIIEKHILKLPETKRIMKLELESVEDFQKRKIRCVIDKMLAEKEPLYESHIYRKASIAKGRISSVDEYLLHVLKTLDKIKVFKDYLN